MHHKEELFKLCVVLLISRCKRFCEVTASFFHAFIASDIFVMPITGLSIKLSRNDTKSLYDWLGDL